MGRLKAGEPRKGFSALILEISLFLIGHLAQTLKPGCALPLHGMSSAYGGPGLFPICRAGEARFVPFASDCFEPTGGYYTRSSQLRAAPNNVQCGELTTDAQIMSHCRVSVAFNCDDRAFSKTLPPFV
ncbi:hypothetical protein MRX96_033602 [Rhipicephalus microplus]